jgi:hypothetical protein
LALGNITVGSLSATANGNILQTPSSSLVISGATSLTATGGVITLTQSGNDFNTVVFTSAKNQGYGGSVSLIDSNGLVIAANSSGDETVNLVANQLTLFPDVTVSGIDIGIRADAMSLLAGSSLTAYGFMDIQPNAANRSMLIGEADPGGVLYLSAADISNLNYGTSLRLGSDNQSYTGTTTVTDGLNVPGSKPLLLRGGGYGSTGTLNVGAVTNHGGDVSLDAGTGGIVVTGLIDTSGELVVDSNSTNGGNFSVISGGNVSLNRVDTSGGGGSNSGYLGGNAGTVMVRATPLSMPMVVMPTRQSTSATVVGSH